MTKKRVLYLTIQELKELGIIKKYLRKKRRNKKKNLVMINNNIKQNNDHMRGYTTSQPEVITNQQQIYRTNELDNQIKYKQLENLNKIANDKLLLEDDQNNNDYFKNNQDEFYKKQIKNINKNMIQGQKSITDIYRILKQKPASDFFKGKDENDDPEDSFFELLDQEVNNNEIIENQQQDIQQPQEEIINNNKVVDEDEQPQEFINNNNDDEEENKKIKAIINNLKEELYEKTGDKHYLNYNYKIQIRTITLLETQLNKLNKLKKSKQKNKIKTKTNKKNI